MSSTTYYSTQTQSDLAFKQIALEQNAQKREALINNWQQNIRSLPTNPVSNQYSQTVYSANGTYGSTAPNVLSGHAGSFSGSQGCRAAAVW